MSRTSGSNFELESVSVIFGDHTALDRVSLAIQPGEIVGAVGPSGSGKTTLLRLLGAVLRPTDGIVRIGNTDVSILGGRQLRTVRSRLGFIHQDLSLVPNLTALQNIILGRIGRMAFLTSIKQVFFPGRQVERDVYRILERVGIPEKLFERVDRLSGGQRQRVAIARALYQEPEVLLADEPVSSVDPARAHDTVGLLTGIAKESGITLVVSLHNLELAQEFLPRLIGLRGGRVAFDSQTPQLGDSDFDELYHLEADEMIEDDTSS